jgi:hypothetical protein
MVFMTKGKRAQLSCTQRNDIWRRWKAGQSLHEIGPALDKPHSSIRDTTSGARFILGGAASTCCIHPTLRELHRAARQVCQRSLAFADGPERLTVEVADNPRRWVGHSLLKVAGTTRCGTLVGRRLEAFVTRRSFELTPLPDLSNSSPLGCLA